MRKTKKQISISPEMQGLVLYVSLNAITILLVVVITFVSL